MKRLTHPVTEQEKKLVAAGERWKITTTDDVCPSRYFRFEYFVRKVEKLWGHTPTPLHPTITGIYTLSADQHQWLDVTHG